MVRNNGHHQLKIENRLFLHMVQPRSVYFWQEGSGNLAGAFSVPPFLPQIIYVGRNRLFDFVITNGEPRLTALCDFGGSPFSESVRYFITDRAFMGLDPSGRLT